MPRTTRPCGSGLATWSRPRGRRADVDCVLALSYAAACRDDAEQAAELIGASGGGLFHDTANFVHHMLIRDRVVRPMLDPPAFEAALGRGTANPSPRSSPNRASGRRRRRRQALAAKELCTATCGSVAGAP
ncbi:hypothetical protein GCM10009558_019680 [Virgisporangium aurantiacum]